MLNFVIHFLVQTVLSAVGRKMEPYGVRAEKSKCQRKDLWGLNISSVDARGNCGVGNRAQEPTSILCCLVLARKGMLMRVGPL